MRLYLAGPMRGLPNQNAEAFHAAAKELREQGYEVLSPVENDVVELGSEVASRNHKLDVDEGTGEYMKRDLPLVFNADGVAVLPGWSQSDGSLCELFNAYMADKVIYGYKDGKLSLLEPHDLAVAIAKRMGLYAWISTKDGH